jgi:hypothetical protein
LLERAREKRHFELPWPTAEYDATPIDTLEIDQSLFGNAGT